MNYSALSASHIDLISAHEMGGAVQLAQQSVRGTMNTMMLPSNDELTKFHEVRFKSHDPYVGLLICLISLSLLVASHISSTTDSANLWRWSRTKPPARPK